MRRKESSKVHHLGYTMLSVLFMHEYFPAQFGGLAHYLAECGHKVVFATAREEQNLARSYSSDNLQLLRYRSSLSPRLGHPFLNMTERALRNGQNFARVAASLSDEGFVPDIVCTHSGWGSGVFAKTIWPTTKLVQYLEWWHNPASNPSEASPGEDQASCLANNLPFLLDYQCADLVIAPTEFQARQAPEYVKQKVVVQYDGIDCDVFRPPVDHEPAFQIKGLPDEAPLVTFAARSLEPIRGFYDCMAAVEKLMRLYPQAHFAVAGEDRARYGPKMKRGQGHKRKMLTRHKLDRHRLHFLGRMTEQDYIRLLRRSSVHLYLSRPFIPSRSLYEAMACARPIVACRIPAVAEALGSEEPALLVEPGDIDQIVASVATLLDHPEHAQAMGLEARNRARDQFGFHTCHPKLAEILSDLVNNGHNSAIAAQ